MSVVNAWRNGKTGYLFTDTAHVEIRTGKVIGFGGKAIYAARWPAVIGATLAGGVIQFLAEPFADNPPKNVRALTRLMPDACQHFCERARKEGSVDPYVRAVAVVWCARTRSIRFFHCASHAEFADPFTVTELDCFIGLGAGLPIVDAIKGKLDAEAPVDSAEAVELMEAQRCAPFESEVPGLSGGCMIGGTIERLTVSRDGVQVDTLHEWPDKVGERLAA